MAADNTDVDAKILIFQWCKILKTSTDYDEWGQPVEAIVGYKGLSGEIPPMIRPNKTIFDDQQKKILQRLAVCLDLRSQALQNPQRSVEVTLDHLKRILAGLSALVEVPSTENFQILSSHNSVQNGGCRKSISGTSPDSLLSLPHLPGGTKISLWIEKIGLKNASQYIESFISTSVKDIKGNDIHPEQDTPMSTHRDENYIYFGTEILLERPLESFPTGFAIFMEFRHYKPKKKNISTKCWTFLEKDEIKDGPVIAELYTKPTDYRRKNINLLTTKPLYLHAKISLS